MSGFRGSYFLCVLPCDLRDSAVRSFPTLALSKSEPIDRIEVQILGALRDALEVSLDDLLVFEAPTKGLQQLSASKQKRLHELMAKNTEGKLGASEREEFLQLGREAERLTLANARQLAAQRKSLQHS
jgi:DNA-binding Xre family transcriptional regulator